MKFLLQKMYSKTRRIHANVHTQLVCRATECVCGCCSTLLFHAAHLFIYVSYVFFVNIHGATFSGSTNFYAPQQTVFDSLSLSLSLVLALRMYTMYNINMIMVARLMWNEKSPLRIAWNESETRIPTFIRMKGERQTKRNERRTIQHNTFFYAIVAVSLFSLSV